MGRNECRVTRRRSAWAAPGRLHSRIGQHGLSFLRAGGFTLIELLVVVAVIALLLALLVPVLSSARRQARAAVCQANTGQWGVIFSVYRTENDGRLLFSPWFAGDSASPYPTGDYNDLEPLFLCPEAKRCDLTGYTDDAPCSGNGGKTTAWWYNWRVNAVGEIASPTRLLRVSYGWNGYMADLSTHLQAVAAMLGTKDATEARRTYALKFWTLGNVKGPSRIPFLFDCAQERITPWSDDQPPAYEEDFVHKRPTQWWEPWHDTIKDACINRHGRGSINAAFVDGSSRRIGLKELWTLKWHIQYNTSGPWTKAGGARPEDWPAWMRNLRDY